jgi:hypothetical protein
MAAPSYWPDLLARVQRQTAGRTRWDIDFYRLRMLLDQMDEADDYLVLADMASKAGLPAEAQQVLDAGLGQGHAGQGPQGRRAPEVPRRGDQAGRR